jgi:serine/threonine-protein kinase
VNARAPSSSDWVTLQPGDKLWDAVPRKRTLRLVSKMTGRLLVGRYRLGRLVDDAALCATYEAYDVETKEQVAIELLSRPTGAGLPSATPLRREARRITDAVHPGLRVVRTIGVEGGVPFIVAGALTGESLRERLARGPLSIAHATSIALQVIGAMTVAHKAGLVHGNLKPEKIRITDGPNGAPVATVMGLGVTALLGTLRDVDTRRLGTPPYLAPEQLEDAREADELGDVWGIGLLLYEMLTGRRAFDGRTAQEVRLRIAAMSIVRLRHLRAEIPLPLERIVGATLARSREQRLTLRDLQRALVEVEAELAAVKKTAPFVIVNVGDPCDDDPEGTTDLLVHVETDLGLL